MTAMTLDQLRDEFLGEARNAPKLFRDLAKVEQYIAESYQTRALIELLQNADDAGATIFGVHTFHTGFIVGNNGRPFTQADVEALCRSGASNKYRGGTTIGYRGIGFKSVANLAKMVFVVSGDFAFYFDKETTQRALHSSDDVPLIRVPHSMEDADPKLQRDLFDLMDTHRYETVFFFSSLSRHVSLEDMPGLDRSSLLFLNKLQTVHIDFEGVQRNITVKRIAQPHRAIITVVEGGDTDEWEVTIPEGDTTNRVAFKKQDNAIIPASPKESVVHSFTPTFEFSGAYIKINGDYTTDPSRKTIYMDDLSQRSFQKAISVLVDSIASILEGDLTRKGFFSPFIDVPLKDSSQFRSLLFKAIETGLVEKGIRTRHGELRSYPSIRLRPEWLNYEDYESLCRVGLASITKDLVVAYPEMPSFLGSVGVRVLSLDEVLERVNSSQFTLVGSAQIFSKIVHQHRYDLDSTRLEKLRYLRLFPVDGSFVQADQLAMTSKLMPEFRGFIQDNTDPSDANMFFRRLGVQIEPLAETVGSQRKGSAQTHPMPGNNEDFSESFKARPAIKKWRSAEQNAAEYLRSLRTILSVADVSQANLGYDLEILLTNGKRAYVEVKSVAHFSEPFKISNNEYASAHRYGEDYHIALVVNEDPFLIQFITNPINILGFEKKCERWSWYCEDYSTVLRHVSQTFT